MIRVFTSKTQKIGELGEKIALKFLVNNGFTIVEQNYGNKVGEIDIVAQKGSTLYLVEVKTQNDKTTISAFENLTKKKLRSLELISAIYIEHRKWKGDYRLIGCLVTIYSATNQAKVSLIDLL